MVIKEEKEFSRSPDKRRRGQEGARNAKGGKDFYLLISFLYLPGDLPGQKRPRTFCGSLSSALFVRGA